MTIYFRFHRGGFAEAMRDVHAFESLNDLFLFLGGFHHSSRQSFRLQPYGYDDRLKSESYIVTRLDRNSDMYFPIGFCWEEK